MRRADPKSFGTLAAWFRPDLHTTLVGSNIIALVDASAGISLVFGGTGNIVYAATDAKLNGKPTATFTGTQKLTVAAAIPSAGATRTLIFVGYSTDNVGGSIATFGTTTKLVQYWLVSGSTTYVASDGIAASQHYLASDVTSNQALCLVETFTPSVGMTFEKNGVPKILAGDILTADVGAYFDLGLGWNGGIGDWLCYSPALSAQQLADLKGSYISPRYSI